MSSSRITWVTITIFDHIMAERGYDPAEDEHLHHELSEALTNLNVHLGQRPIMLFRPCKTFLLFRLDLPNTTEARKLIDNLVASVDTLVAGWTVDAVVFCDEKGPIKGLAKLCGLDAEEIEPVRARHLKQLVESWEHEEGVDERGLCVPA